MKLAFLKSGWLLTVLGLVLIGLFIWYAGPYIAFADWHPLEPATWRIVLIVALVALRAAFLLGKRVRAGRATDRLMAGVAKSASADTSRPSAEAAALRERFEEAVASLKQSHRSLYDLPWYVFIGAPGSGKTTALVNSGLKFPLEQRLGKGPVGGVGGTRNCTWWFTDEAVFLDTAGRYTTQDSDPTGDSAAWTEFLGLLRQYRKRRPLNGVILTISAADLMTLGADGRESYVAAARRRLDELNKELRVRLPVYVLVTKTDLVAGFEEYFADQTAEGRAQVWGVTFPYQQTLRGEAAKGFAPEFDALMLRLTERLFARLNEESDPRRRTKVFGFPQQMAALRDLLDEFIGEVFGSTRFDRQILLRGVYFTSGTQEGTPVDRLLAAIGRRFQVAPDAVAPGARGKAYFIERLLKEVVIGESGVAGVNRRLEMRQAAIQLGAYAAMAAVTVLGFLALSVSYARNQGYLRDVSDAVAALGRTRPVVAGASLDAVLPRLDAVRAVSETANRYRAHAPLLMRWGLFQGRAIGNAARDAYGRELDDGLLPHLADRIARRMAAYGADPDKLYEYLKAYLMLGDPRHLDKAHLGFVADLEWRSDSTSPDMALALSKHFKSLLDQDATLRPIALDNSLVAQARATIQRASIPRLIYNRLKLMHADDPRGLRLDEAAGMGADQVLRRRSGRKLSDPIPYFYTAAGFKEVTGAGASEVVKQFGADSWVWGESGPALGDSVRLGEQVFALYEQDYIAQWDAVLSDVTATSGTLQQLTILASPSSSPLRGLYGTIDANTYLVKPPDASAAGGTAETARQTVMNKIFGAGKAAVGAPSVTPGTQVTQHFGQLHLFMSGSPAKIDMLLAKLQGIQQKMLAMGTGPGKASALDTLGSDLRQALEELKLDSALLPSGVKDLAKQVGGRAEAAVSSGAASELVNRYNQEVLRECTAAIEGRYPFNPTSATEVPLEDFGRVFGYGGVFDSFFTANLVKLVDTTRTPWTWQPGTVGLSSAMLRKFEAAQRVRRMFFATGSRAPQVRFTLAPSDLDNRTAKFQITFDGKKFEYKPGQTQNFAAGWPGDGGGQVVVLFDGGRLSRADSKTFDGPWAFFRFVDFGGPQRESDVRMMLRYELSGHSVRARLDAGRVENPFTDRSWQQFRCGF